MNVDQWPCGKSKENWFSIETAPKDDTRILIYRHGWAEDTSLCYWDTHYKHWVSVTGGMPFVTYWDDDVLWAEIPW